MNQNMTKPFIQKLHFRRPNKNSQKKKKIIFKYEFLASLKVQSLKTEKSLFVHKFFNLKIKQNILVEKIKAM